ncbi:MAG: hypothetical protein P8J87_20210 [Verrucomicrobiales bacterium]|nr:hypothetical protein [Verrucomicrobiales bacterium]
MKNSLIFTLAAALLSSCASFPDLAWDADLYNKSPVVLRVDILPGHDNLRRNRQFPVRVLKVYKNTTDLDIPKTLEVASTAEWGGLPSCGKCTVYLRQNRSKLEQAPELALDEPSGVYIHKHTPAYSHHVFPNNSPVPEITRNSPDDDSQNEPADGEQENSQPDADNTSPSDKPEPSPKTDPGSEQDPEPDPEPDSGSEPDPKPDSEPAEPAVTGA